MLNLSPLKILVVLVVTLLVVGPERLPQIARQLGGAWKALRSFRTRVEDEVRANMPDLPSTGDLARFALLRRSHCSTSSPASTRR